MIDLKNKTILTGIKPTGTLHFGNYAGALKPAVELGHQVNREGGRHIMFVADYHAINAIKDAPLLKQLTREIACAYLACGLDPKKSYFYKQSDVPELFELTTILMAYTPKGFMNKAHAYKAAVDKNTAKGEPPDAGINMGLYTYPVLMAADILAYDTDLVPVGKDQIQHVEIAADIAGSINAHYGSPVFKLPRYTDALLVNDTKESAEETILLLQTLGIDHINLSPYYPDVKEYPHLSIAITPGEAEHVPSFVRKIIDIKTRLVDITSLIEILTYFNMLEKFAHILSAKYIQDIIQLIKTGNKGYYRKKLSIK